jgi:hypothetical protein
MEIIRARVRTRGHALDDFEGLGFKAHLVRGTQYAPFDVWNTSKGMADFLHRGGFQAIWRAAADRRSSTGQDWRSCAVTPGKRTSRRARSRGSHRRRTRSTP